ncbi:hypothetical protein AVEN_100980-1 [Araneus ventricosus]|uniref:Uncharacterized protein n=1 Tax=Araneus ventricosus TaxID=182803 RepID=A0A4Y2KA24_ARAVE|nr:hypothetical protein AVEN_100980-1 [Araneus ventricosus]
MSGDRGGHAMIAPPDYPPLGECCIQKLTNNVAVLWKSAVLLKDDTFWKLWNCIQLQHVKVDVSRRNRLRTVRGVASSPARAHRCTTDTIGDTVQCSSSFNFSFRFCSPQQAFITAP